MKRLLLPLLLSLLPMAARADLAGRVVDATGKPVPNAEVSIAPFREGDTVRADARGEFTLSFSGVRHLILVAYAPGLAPAAASLRSDGGPIVLRLLPPRAISGKLLAPDGTPAEGVSVCISQLGTTGERPDGTPAGPEALIALPASVQEQLTTRSDAAGFYRLGGLPPGQLRLRIHDPRFVTDNGMG